MKYSSQEKLVPSSRTGVWSVRTFLIFLVIAILVPGVIGAGGLLVHQYRDGSARLEHDTIQTARALTQTVDAYLGEALVMAKTLATDNSLASGDFAGFHHRARDVLASSGIGSNIVVLDKNGQHLINAQLELGKSLPRSPNAAIIQQVFSNGLPAISDLVIAPLYSRPAVAIYVPAVVRGRVAYVVSVVLLTERFDGILRTQKLPGTWVASILDSSGTIVARTRDAEKFVGKKGKAEFLERLKQYPEGAIEMVSIEGVQSLVVHSRSSATSWSIGMAIPLQELSSRLENTLISLAVGVAILFGIGCGLAWFIGRRIADCVRSLKAVAMDVGQGKIVTPPQLPMQETEEIAHAIAAAGKLLGETQRLAKLGSWYWNAKTDSAIASEEVLRIFGIDRIPNFGDQKGALYPVEAWEKLNAAVQEAVRSDTGYDLVLPALRGGCMPIWINTRGEAVRDSNGETIGLRGTVQDVTERKEAESALERERASRREELEQEVAQRTAELSAANQELEAFTFATSHDLKGPLGRINSFSTLLEKSCRDRLEGDSLLFLDIIRQNASRLTLLVEDLLSHARIAQQTLELQSIDISDSVEAVVQDKAQEVLENKAEIRLSVPPVKVLADPHALGQALGNLVENAIKYSSQVASPFIEVGGEMTGDRFRLWVRDNGIGFKMEYHDKIFQMFQRLHTYTEYAGSGVGLALVKRAVERMGGEVWAESQPGQGATFFLELKLA